MLTDVEYKNLKKACSGLGEGPDYRDGDFIRNLQITALDFQLNVKTVNNAIAWYNDNHRSSIKTFESIKHFLASYPNTKAGNLKAAQFLWSNRCWTRLAFLRVIVSYFDEQEIDDIKALRKWANTSTFAKNVKGQIRSKHHSMGPAIYHWLLLRVGVPTIKPDLHVRRFVQAQIGRWPSAQETVESLVRIATELSRQPHEVDAAIWHLQSGYA